MPTYEYRCKACGHELEVVQSFTDDALTECPDCQGPLRKIFGNVGISFKGSGFYKNDSRGSSSSTKVGSGASSDGGSSESKSETTTETKTETKTETRTDTKKDTKSESATPKAPAATATS